ncbi:MAG: SBBP repeat-containing protein, partial [Bacteroidota bacterium]
MKRVFSLLTSLILLHFLPAQDYEWAHRIGNGNADQGRGIAADANGNVYICGVFSGTIDMDPGAGISNLTSAGGQDIFIAQYSPVGALNWAVRVGGTVNDLPIDLAVDASSNVIVTGVFRGTVDFNPGAGVANTTSSGQEDMFLLKLNSLGAYQWHVAVGGTANDGGHAVATDANDAIYVTGGFEGILIDFNPNGVASTEISFGQENIFIAKYNALGILQWVENIGNTSTDDLGQGIATDNNGDVYVTGWF